MSPQHAMSALNIATLTLSQMVDYTNMVIVPCGTAALYRGPIGCGKTQSLTANMRWQQDDDPDFGGCLMNLANAESIDLRGLPQLDPVFSRYGLPPWLQAVPEMGLRGAFPALCPEHLRGDPATWSPELREAYETAEIQVRIRKLTPYKRGLVVLDECLQVVDDSVLLSLGQMFDEHRIGEWGVPLFGWGIVGLTNRTTDKAAVRELFAHVRNRIEVFDIQNDPDAVDAHWSATGMNESFRIFARVEPTTVFADEVPPGQTQFCTARSWEKAQQSVLTWLMNKDGVAYDDLPVVRISHKHEVVPKIIAARCGNEAALAFMDFLRNQEYRPEFGDIVKAPAKAMLPSMDAVIVAVVEMCVARVDMKTLDKVCAYMMRDDMPVMFKSLFCQRLARRVNVQTLFVHTGFMALVNKAGPSCRQLLFAAEHDTGAAA
jgi:hypothetical protein